MDYALAKELKDAGFPRPISWHCINKDAAHGHCRADKPDCKIQLLAVPTLEELIEACGDKFGELMLMVGGSGGRWRATSEDGRSHPRGHTPTEAVARLWLALNPRA
jgi:hypothetical protein